MSKSNLFDKLYSASKEALKELKKPIVERRLKRKYQSAHDSAEDQKIEAEQKLEKVREDFDNFDINRVIEAKATITAAEQTKKAIAEDYLEMFGEEINS